MRNVSAIAVALLTVAMVIGPVQTQVLAYDIGTVSLLNGDVNGDNAVNDTDRDILLPNLDLTGVSGDLDGDNLVTTTDLSILLKNLGQTGAS